MGSSPMPGSRLLRQSGHLPGPPNPKATSQKSSAQSSCNGQSGVHRIIDYMDSMDWSDVRLLPELPTLAERPFADVTLDDASIAPRRGSPCWTSWERNRPPSTSTVFPQPPCWEVTSWPASRELIDGEPFILQRPASDDCTAL